MVTTPKHDQRIAKMTFASVYPMYVEKVEKKGRTKEELHQVITWLTGFDDKKLQQLIEVEVTFASFFQQASLNPNAELITRSEEHTSELQSLMRISYAVFCLKKKK